MHCNAMSESSSPARILISGFVVFNYFCSRLTIRNAVSPWYQVDIGPRLKPKTREVYEKWAGIPSDRLFSHLHEMASPLNHSNSMLNLLKVACSGTERGNFASTLALENGSFYCRAFRDFLGILRYWPEHGPVTQS